MKIYVVNLDKNLERMTSIESQLRSFGLQFERFPAVYGKTLSAEERRNCYRPFRALCNLGVVMTDGEIGCALSHVGIYRKIVDENTPVCLVLEDDVLLASDFPHVVEKAADFMDSSRPQVVILSSWGDHGTHEEGIQRVDSASCTDGYLVTNAAADLLLTQNFPVITVADRWSRWTHRCGLELYRAFPTTVRQDNNRFGTDVDSWELSAVAGGKTKRRGVFCTLIWKIYRMFGLTVDWMLWKVTGR